MTLEQQERTGGVLGPLVRFPGVSALIAGAGAALALPPVHFYPSLVAFGLWLWLLRQARRRRDVARIGLAFGYGWYLTSLYWVAIAFYSDAERFGALAVPAVLLLALANALFVMASALLAGWRHWRSPIAHALILAVAWSTLEYLRGAHGVSFPWNPLAIVWAPVPELLQVSAHVGSRGASLLTLITALLWVTIFTSRGRWVGPLTSLVILAGLWGTGAARIATTELLPPTGVQLRIVQGNIAQHHKWDPDKRFQWLERYRELTASERSEPPRFVVWPESAVPYLLEREPMVREALAVVAPGHGYLLVGGDRFELDREPPIANNSLFVLDNRGEIRGRYDKVDLVPFGEFLPARSLLSGLGLSKLTEGTIDFVPGPGRRTLTLPDLPPFSPLVCYEAIFPGDAVPASSRPSWLLNVTNDAWFGRSAGPYQHLAMARLRAVEEGLPLVRAANTGISVVVDAFGRDVARLGLGETGVVDAELPPATPEPTLFRLLTPYGELFLLIVVSLAGIFAETRGMRARAARAAE